ncbi:hypothetical protein D8Y23_08110 [Microbacterium enclense]|uniref:Uncharacterized protein n=1 Tax=Microbacterium enclense TaxID=993073 RepID=A0A443JF84_9MICO|nr:hypothetical protein D8Y23_08110 [Microbacterium enclense]
MIGGRDPRTPGRRHGIAGRDLGLLDAGTGSSAAGAGRGVAHGCLVVGVRGCLVVGGDTTPPTGNGRLVDDSALDGTTRRSRGRNADRLVVDDLGRGGHRLRTWHTHRVVRRSVA